MDKRKNIIKGNIANALHSTAADHVTAVADDVFDENLQEYQSDINSTRKKEIALLKYKKAKITLIGDSISTYEGWIPEGYANYYPQGAIDSVEKTYWYLLCSMLNASIQNLSYAGSTVTNQNVPEVNLYKRIPLVNSDSSLIIIALGVNDKQKEDNVGEYDYNKKIEEYDESIFTEAYIKAVRTLMQLHPSADLLLVAMASSNSMPNRTAAIKEIAKHYDLMFFDARSCYGGSVHPDIDATDNGTEMKNIADGIFNCISSNVSLGLSESINAGLDKKFDKEAIAQELGESKENVVSQFALPFRMVENSMYLYAIVDSVNHLIAGIKKDGSIEWKKGIPTPIKVVLEAVIKLAEQNKLDIAEILSSLNKAISDLNKTTIKNEDGSVVETPFCYKQNERVLYAKTDAVGKMLLGFKKNGQPVFGVGVPEQIQEGIDESAEKVKNDINSDVDDKINLGSNIYPNKIQSVTENNKYKEVVISKDNKILRGINRENEEEIYLPQNFFGTKTIFSIENANYLEILYSIGGRMLSSRDKNGMLSEYGGVNAPFYLKNGTEIRTLSYEDTIYVAAKDSDDTDKASADYICDGVNDEEEINEAIVALKKRSGLRYKKVVLFSGHYYVDSFPEVLGDWKSAIAFHSDNRMLGDSLTISGISHYYRSTVIYVTEKALNSIADNTKHSVIMCMPSTKDNSVVRFDVQNIMIALANNQHPIVAVNLQYGDCGECKNIYMTASGLYDNSETGINTGTSVRDKAVEGVIALRSYHGYTIGDTVRFDNICAFGFYTAFQLGCEHAIYNNLRSRFCHMGYTFGEYHTELVRGAFDHPMTLINCCDEQSIQGPVFAWNGLIDRSILETHPGEKDKKLQSVTFIDFNYEIPHYAAYEVEPGTFCGLILYHPSDGTFGGKPHYSFWKEGSGKNFNTINLTQANGGTSELRKSYGAHYMQHFFDTDLNKEVIFNGTNWVDCLGNIVQ